MTKTTLLTPQSSDDFKLYYNLRWRILREPWQQPCGSEKDELEDHSYHLMLCQLPVYQENTNEQDANPQNTNFNTPLAIGRLHFNTPEEAQIRYMAVETNQQGKGHGKHVLQGLEQYALESGAKIIILHARETVSGFYLKQGYEIVAPSHVLFGTIQHVKMRKTLKEAGNTIDK